MALSQCVGEDESRRTGVPGGRVGTDNWPVHHDVQCAGAASAVAVRRCRSLVESGDAPGTHATSITDPAPGPNAAPWAARRAPGRPGPATRRPSPAPGFGGGRQAGPGALLCH
jgi:hypothetical protein